MEIEQRLGDHRAHQKLQEIRSFDAQNLNGLKLSEVQTEAPSNFNPEALIKAFDESRIILLEKAIEDNKINQEKEMKEFNESHARNIEKLTEKLKRVMEEEAEQSFDKYALGVIEANKQMLITPITENSVMKNEAKEFVGIEVPISCNQKPFRYWQSYIGQICLDLQANMYQIVLADQFAEDWFYKVKDIEDDIDDEDLLNEEEREEASKRWENLKEQIRWDPSLERTLEMFEEKANSSMVRPECLTVEEAERAAEELNKQGRLKGALSYEKVKQIIEMWEKSTTLIQ